MVTKAKSEPAYVAVVIADDTASKILVKDGPDGELFQIPIYPIQNHILGGDWLYNARVQFQNETGVPHEHGYWITVGNVELPDKLVHLYIATYLQEPVPPEGWHWCTFSEFVLQTLNSPSDNPEIQTSQSLAAVALDKLIPLNLCGRRQ